MKFIKKVIKPNRVHDLGCRGQEGGGVDPICHCLNN